jgi:membrane protein YqaA with SNARE-associated domain
MDFLFTAEAGLSGLFLASFLAATLLPGGSEAVLLAVLLAHPEQALPAWVLATVGNTLGGMTTYVMGRWLPDTNSARVGVTEGNPCGTGRTAIRSQKVLAALHKHGTPLLGLAWVPFIGDLLCAAAGWLRLPWLASALWMLVGKGVRYAVLMAGVGAL